MVLDIIIFLALVVILNILNYIIFLVIEYNIDNLYMANFAVFIIVGFAQSEGTYLNIVLASIASVLAIQHLIYKIKENKRISRDKISRT